MKNLHLQIALDFDDLDRAIKLAHEAVKGGADWIEVGTPLIKSEGMNAIRIIKKEFPDKTIIADMKIMDVGSFEVDMAAKSGADIIVVLGVADNSTIKEAVESAKKYGAQIMADLINVENMPERAVKLEAMGVNYICVHVGIDQQMRGITPIDITKKVSEVISNAEIAVAGGLNSETVVDAVKAGANIIIVGHAITAAENATIATRNIIKAMKTGKKIETQAFRKYSQEKLRDVFHKVSSCNISDAMHKMGELRNLHPIVPGIKMVGTAVTVRCFNGDWSKTVEAIDIAEPGQVIVIEESGSLAVWGELASWSSKIKGIAGVVIDGAIRDVDEIKKIRFPAFARTVNPTAGEPKGFGEINIEIICSGQKIRPGDWIIGDETGVVVVPKEKAHQIANRALMIYENEARIREEIKQGNTLGKILKLKRWEKILG